MEKTNWMKRIVSSLLAAVLLFGQPLESVAQTSVNRSNLLEMGTPLVLRVSEYFKSDNQTESGYINSIVETDVYSSDGTQVLIKAGTPALIEYNSEPNGSWGKAGKICLTHATTKTIDNKRISLHLNSCKNGGGKLGGVIALSVLFFPIGLISGCMKGSMPKIEQGSTFHASTMQDIVVE